MFRLIPGLEQAEIMRYGYAVEYDYCPPDQLQPSLETKRVAGPVLRRPDQRHDRLRRGRRQGLIAGVNAALDAARRRAAGARSRPGLHRRADRRPGDARRRRAVPHVHQPRRVSPAAAARQRRPPADAARPRSRAWSTTRAGSASSARRREIAQAREMLDATRWRRWHAGRSCCGAPETTWAEIVARLPALAERSRRGGRAGDVRRQVRRLRRAARDRSRRASSGWRRSAFPTSFDYASDRSAAHRSPREAVARSARSASPRPAASAASRRPTWRCCWCIWKGSG